MTTTTNRPVPFSGTDLERSQNRATHFYVSVGPEDSGRCFSCDCRPSHVAADYPCGQEPPREIAGGSPTEYLARLDQEMDELSREAVDIQIGDGTHPVGIRLPAADQARLDEIQKRSKEISLEFNRYRGLGI